MAIRTSSPPQVRLNVPVGRPALMMDLNHFFEFSFWMAEELLDLEAEYSEWQTPASKGALPEFDGNGLPEDLKIDFENC